MQRREYGEMTTLETRSEANETVDRNKRYKQVMECMIAAGPVGMTAKECAVAMNLRGDIPTSERNFTAPRINELCEKGLLEPIGRKKCRYTGKTVTVFAVREIDDGR